MLGAAKGAGNLTVQTTQTHPVHPHPTERKIRHDLTGLAGLAIVLVVVCDTWFGRISSAIDVLLVLTGFVFGGRVLRSVGTAQPVSLTGDMAWAARRLLPALVFLLAVCAALTVTVQPQTRWEAFADQTLASLGFYQNWQLIWTAGDYLQASEAVTPLQHLWVVSVVGQVMVFLLVLAAMVTLVTVRSSHRHRRNLFIAAVCFSMLASFGYAAVVHSGNPIVAYYSSISRAWELLAGVAAAAIAARISWPGRLRAVAAAIGLTSIVLCGLLVDGVMAGPGLVAVIPVGVTVMVVLIGAHSGSGAWTNRVLSSTPLVTLGAVAYSLYLWHWPLLIFWLAYTNDDAVGLVGGSVVIALTVVVAVLTRRRQLARPRMLSGASIVLVVVVLAGLSIAWRGHVAHARSSGAELATLSMRDYPGARALTDNRRVAKLPMRPTALEASGDVPPSTIDGCVMGFDGSEVVTCVYGNPKADRTIALAGGSHSEHWLTALHTIGRQHGFKVTTYLKLGCPLTTKEVPLIAGPFEPYPSCREWSDNALARIIADRPDYVFFTTTRPILNGPGDYVPDYYLGIWDELSANGIPMLGVRDTPWMLREGMFFSPVDCLSAGGDADGCGSPRHEALAERNPTLDHIDDYPLMTLLDLSDAVCRDDICRAAEGNVLIYHDAHHLSATYVRTLTDELARQLSDATSWW